MAGIASSLGTEGATVGFGDVGLTLGITLGKVAAFVAVMLLLGRKAVPWVLHYIAYTGSRELFRLAVLAIALGIAFGAAALFGVSFALGAFFAGMVLSESELSHRAAEETLPLRDAFAVLFFVSVGMLLDPMAMLERFWPLLGALAIVLFGKSIAAFFIVRAFGHSTGVALVISASLAQIGEFSFILAGLGVALGILTEPAQDLILTAAIISILLNPTAFALLDRLRSRIGAAARGEEKGAATRDIRPTALTGHVILVGYGRVGSVIGDALRKAATPFLVMDTRHPALEPLAESGIETITGNAAEHELFAAARPELARCLFVAVPDAFEAGAIVEQARAANPNLPIIARVHSDAEAGHLTALGATSTVVGETELALEMLRRAQIAPA
jgi:CPA2 family monovalent cation:H+ antiporter-2